MTLAVCMVSDLDRRSEHPICQSPQVPLLDLKPQNAEIEAELKTVFETVLNSGIFILGREVERFEEQIAELSGTKHGIGVSSGIDALLPAGSFWRLFGSIRRPNGFSRHTTNLG